VSVLVANHSKASNAHATIQALVKEIWPLDSLSKHYSVGMSAFEPLRCCAIPCCQQVYFIPIGRALRQQQCPLDSIGCWPGHRRRR
jgi:hypothetical protein